MLLILHKMGSLSFFKLPCETEKNADAFRKQLIKINATLKAAALLL